MKLLVLCILHVRRGYFPDLNNTKSQRIIYLFKKVWWVFDWVIHFTIRIIMLSTFIFVEILCFLETAVNCFLCFLVFNFGFFTLRCCYTIWCRDSISSDNLRSLQLSLHNFIFNLRLIAILAIFINGYSFFL